MAKRAKQLSGFKKFAITCSVLIAGQITFLWLYGGPPAPLPPRDAISEALKNSGEVSDERKETLKVQLALADFRSKKGKYPSKLSELVPEYFDVIPKDPSNGDELGYTVTNGRYRLGTGKKASPTGSNPSVIQDLNIDPVLLASLEQDDSERASFVYDPTGKRDPFMPYDLSPKMANRGGTELENYEIGQLRYTSFLASSGEPIAIVENAARRGFTVRRGIKIGTRGGVVVDILPTKIQVLETFLDPITGETKNQTVELELRPNKK